MKYFGNISDINELKLRYRRLAMLNHPDLGGNPDKMALINKEYRLLIDNINRGKSFFDIKVGDFVIVNGSTSEVINTKGYYFIARSLYSNRLAKFYKSSGICINNPVFKASSIKHSDKWQKKI